MQIFSGHTNRVNDVAFPLDGKSLVSCSTDGTVRVWDCMSGKGDIIHSVDTSPLNELGSVGFVAGTGLVIRPRWRGLKAWDEKTKWSVTTLVDATEAAVHGFALPQSGEKIAIIVWSSDFNTRVVRVWDTRTWKQEAQLQLPDNDAFRGLCFDPSGTRLGTSAGVLDFRTGTLASGFGFPGDTLAWSGSGELVAGMRYGSKSIQVFHAASGRVAHTISLGLKQVQDFDFSPNGKHLAVVSNEETVRIWDTQTWEEQPTLAWGIGKLKCIAFSPDGTRAACGSHRGTILVWDWDG